MLRGEMPGVPRITFGAVDVRDVAVLELLAMIKPEANGQRYIAISGRPLPFIEYANILRQRLGPRGAFPIGSSAYSSCSSPRWGRLCPSWASVVSPRPRRPFAN